MTVVVTGGVRGVGLGITTAFRAAGAHVITCARREPDGLPEGVGFERVDVRDADAVADFIGGIADLDVVVNNAGGTPYLPASEGDARRHAKVIELNLIAPLIVSRAANRVLQGRPGGGSIIMIGSVSGHRPSPGTAAYGAAKAGLDNLTASLAVEWAPRVRVNAVTVGMVRTEKSAMHYGDAAGVAAVARTVPLGRLAEPADVGHACVFLASPSAAYISGASLLLHGGGERPAFLDAAAQASTASPTRGQQPSTGDAIADTHTPDREDNA
ncbi:short chain dehydrogenase [Nocardiopsis gilva YIM 90087]|uniref:Short chain dehydrogenase n=3 Tax=Nocardiopsis gilva TaxID=280236 RepID=A0A223SDB8_9ACTN|nr:short chain dehydrogenase [Nocardiopsis gilva YIM 90087]